MEWTELISVGRLQQLLMILCWRRRWENPYLTSAHWAETRHPNTGVGMVPRRGTKWRHCYGPCYFLLPRELAWNEWMDIKWINWPTQNDDTPYNSISSNTYIPKNCFDYEISYCPMHSTLNSCQNMHAPLLVRLASWVSREGNDWLTKQHQMIAFDTRTSQTNNHQTQFTNKHASPPNDATRLQPT